MLPDPSDDAWRHHPLTYHRMMNASANRILRQHDLVIHLIPAGVFVILLAAGPLLQVHAGFTVTVLGGLVPVWVIWRELWKKRIIAQVVSGSLCIRCGYTLRTGPHAPDKPGTCPECGMPYRPNYYRPPKRGYLGGAVDPYVEDSTRIRPP